MSVLCRISTFTQLWKSMGVSMEMKFKVRPLQKASTPAINDFPQLEKRRESPSSAGGNNESNSMRPNIMQSVAVLARMHGVYQYCWGSSTFWYIRMCFIRLTFDEKLAPVWSGLYFIPWHTSSEHVKADTCGWKPAKFKCCQWRHQLLLAVFNRNAVLNQLSSQEHSKVQNYYPWRTSEVNRIS